MLNFTVNSREKNWIIKNTVCPSCLSELNYDNIDFSNKCQKIICNNCKNHYFILYGLPIFHLASGDWAHLNSEITGELTFNYEQISLDKHIEWNINMSKETIEKINFINLNISNPLILDVGAGNSIEAFCLEKTLGGKVIGVDLVPETIMMGCALENYGFQIPLLSCDLDYLPFPNSFFDIVFLRATLHHVSNLNKSLKELFRVLKLSGVVICFDEPGLGFKGMFQKIRGNLTIPHQDDDINESYFSVIKWYFSFRKLSSDVKFIIPVNAIQKFNNYPILRNIFKKYLILSYIRRLQKMMIKTWVKINIISRKTKEFKFKNGRTIIYKPVHDKPYNLNTSIVSNGIKDISTIFDYVKRELNL